MTHRNNSTIEANGLLKQFLYCQFIEKKNPELETTTIFENSTTTTTTATTVAATIAAATTAATEPEIGKSAMPVRRRNSPPTPKTATTTTTTTTAGQQPQQQRRPPRQHSASTHGHAGSRRTKKPPVFPPPPPMPSTTGRNGGAQHPSTSTDFLVDPSPGSASYHPDFMFCGFCADCQEESGNTNTNSSNREDGGSDSHSNSNSTPEGEGVRNNNTANIAAIGDHSDSDIVSMYYANNSNDRRGTTTTTATTNASTSTSAIHPSSENGSAPRVANANATTAAAPDDDASWVRSSFDVEGICCASEIPVIRRILKPLWGVDTVNINLTTKAVHVKHNYHHIDASSIARTLTEKGFPARSLRDGGAAAEVRATAHGDGPSSDKATAAKVAKLLEQIGQSQYVESTLTIEGLRPNQVPAIEKAVADSFIRVQVRAVYPSASAETVKVEHNPNLVSIDDIREVLQEYTAKRGGSRYFPSAVEVWIDGAETNLYLPSEDDYPNQPMMGRNDDGFVSKLKRYQINVWFSGIFWVLSMLGIVDGMDRFKYFGLASVFFGLPPIMVKASRTARRCEFDANCMMVTAALGALALGEYDEAASVSFLFAVSECLEARAAMKARKALSEICGLRPDHANVIHPITNGVVVVPADRVPLGARISVRTGDKIAADGFVVEGSTSVDESSLTGESTPVHKTVGDKVSGGTINVGQTQLVVQTTTTVEDSAVSRLIRLVEEAQSNRSPTEMMVDSFARSYTPSVIVIAILMCTIPWYFGTETGRNWTMKGLIIVVIACPCALTISTPVTYAAGLAATAKRGVVIKGGAKLEAMGSVDRVVFDKTGTLTKGKFSVTHMEVIGTSKTRQQMLELLSLMQDRASHPIASSLVHAAKVEGVGVPRRMTVSDHRILKGEGITAKVDGHLEVYVGNQRLFKRLGMFDSLSSKNKDTVNEWEDSGGTVGFIGTHDNGIIGTFCVKDSVREEARQALEELKEAGIETYMCTGDSNATAQAVAKEIGILGHCVNSQLLPEDKLRFVKQLRRPEPKKFSFCRKKQYVLFCGDGVNDTPALAAVDVGVSMGEGAAMALEMSDVTLMDSRLTKLPYVIKMGQRVLRTVKENITISFAAKFVVVLMTFMGKMTLLYAIASDVGVMLLVTLNGMKLLPDDRTDPIIWIQSRRARAIVKKMNGPGNNANFELISMEPCESESCDLRVPEIV